MPSIWQPITVGRISLSHRLALSPLTRSRAMPDGTPGPHSAEYYAQRASLGLLITEGTQPSADGQGFPDTPGIYTDHHVAGWAKVARAVHDNGGHLFIQLMHAGRMAHPDNRPHGRVPLAPSAIVPDEKMYTHGGLKEVPVPQPLSEAGIRDTIADFRRAAAKAVEAGADGIEIHGANGYLIQQFLSPNSNQRSDAYGGSIENRSRFALEVAAAVANEVGADRVGIRLSPGSHLGGIDEGEEHPALYRYLTEELAKLDLAYLHIAHGGNDGLLRDIRARWPNALLVNRGNRPIEAIGADIAAGLADMAPVGRWALANPDLVERLRTNTPLNTPDPTTFYGGGTKGYTDYPALRENDRAQAVA